MPSEEPWTPSSAGSSAIALSELARLVRGEVLTETDARASVARDTWPLVLADRRDGKEAQLPTAVVRPQDADDVSALLAWCGERGVAVIPAGGRSGVCGGIAVDGGALGGRDAVLLDLRSLTGVEVEPHDLLATAAAGTSGPAWEEALGRHGLTGGHYPQSLALSTVGGWLACRSAGQFSSAYGRAEDRLAGLEVVLASGERIGFPSHPATAAGPDLSRLFVGAEGTLGVIVEVTMRVTRMVERRPRAVAFDTFAEGTEAVRGVVQAGLRPAVVRLYDPDDTAFSFPGQDGCVLVLVFEGPLGAETEDATLRMLGGRGLGAGPAEHWLAHRNDAAARLEEVMAPDGPLGPHAIVDTMEVAASWSTLGELYAAMRGALVPHALGVLCHMSHVYPDGACLYLTTAVTGDGPDDARRRYEAVWRDGMEACLGAGGTITHHHGIGRLKAPWLRRELGDEGWGLLRTMKEALDPRSILNPGNLGLGAG